MECGPTYLPDFQVSDFPRPLLRKGLKETDWRKTNWE